MKSLRNRIRVTLIGTHAVNKTLVPSVKRVARANRVEHPENRMFIAAIIDELTWCTQTL